MVHALYLTLPPAPAQTTALRITTYTPKPHPQQRFASQQHFDPALGRIYSYAHRTTNNHYHYDLFLYLLYSSRPRPHALLALPHKYLPHPGCTTRRACQDEPRRKQNKNIAHPPKLACNRSFAYHPVRQKPLTTDHAHTSQALPLRTNHAPKETRNQLGADSRS